MHMSICINMLWERRQESLFRVDMYVPKTSIGKETGETKYGGTMSPGRGREPEESGRKR